MRYKYCPNCGAKVPINNKFCPKCGHALNINQVVQPRMNHPFNNPQHKHHYGRWIVGIVAIIVIFILVMPLFDGSNHSSDNNTSSQTQSSNSNNIAQIHSNEYSNVIDPMWQSVEGALIDTESGEQGSFDTNKDYNSIARYFAGGKHNSSAKALIAWVKSNIPAARANRKAYEGASVSNFKPSGNKATMHVHYEEDVNTTGNTNGTMETQDQVYMWTATFDKNTHLIKSLKKRNKPLSQTTKKDHKTKAEKEGIP